MARIVGTWGADWLNGGRYGDRIYGLGGDDDIYAARGNDVVSGGEGADHINGGGGADRLWGDAGDDAIYGDGRIDWSPDQPKDGNDFLSGGLGNDVLSGGDGFDRMTGGDGNDYLIDLDGASAWGDAGSDGFKIATGFAYGGDGDDWFGITYSDRQGEVTWTGGPGADLFQPNFYINDGTAQHVVIADFNPAEGDHLSMQVDDAASGYHADLPALLIALDTDRDNRLTGLQADGTGDLFCRQGADGLSILIWEDTDTVANVAALDLSMFG